MSIIKRFYNRHLRQKNYIEFLRNRGIQIGSDTIISNEYSIIDFQAPFLITIGNNVYITSGCTILTHDYSKVVIGRKKGNLLGFGGPVTIKDNVFIGMHTTILPNTTIDDNVIIGANSLVKGHLKSGYVYAGNPAKPICSLEQYEKKREANQIEEAKLIVKQYFTKYKKMPEEKIFRLYGYQWLWSDITKSEIFGIGFSTINNDIALQYMSTKKRPYKNYQDFLSSLNLDN